MMRDVLVRDVGPRDGLQMVKSVLPTKTKLDWIRADVAAGVPEIEVCSFVPPTSSPSSPTRSRWRPTAAKIPGYPPSALTPNLEGRRDRLSHRHPQDELRHVGQRDP